MDKPLAAPAAGSLWRSRDYLWLWGGQAVSSVGTGISQFAFPLLILVQTHSPAAAGFATALGQAPYLIFSLPAGARAFPSCASASSMLSSRQPRARRALPDSSHLRTSPGSSPLLLCKRPTSKDA